MGLGEKDIFDIGDYSFILASTNDRVPSVYLENDKVLNLDKKITKVLIENPQLLKLLPSHSRNEISINLSRVGEIIKKSTCYIEKNCFLAK